MTEQDIRNMLFSDTYPNNTLNSGIQQGWICPRCGKVNAPWMPQCNCKQEEQKITCDGIKPNYAFSGWPDITNCLKDCRKCFSKCLYRKEERLPSQTDSTFDFGKMKTGDLYLDNSGTICCLT